MRTTSRTLLALLPAFVLLVAPLRAAAQAAPFCADGQSLDWLDPFGQLSNQLGDTMGQPIECPRLGTESGDTLQQTTTGTAILRQPAGIATFTDGATHWALTDDGLVSWTSQSLDPPRPQVACGALPIRGFGQIYGKRPEPFNLLGCPTSTESSLEVISQPFEHGWMIWRAPRGPGDPPGIFALFDDSQLYARFDDTYTAGVDLPSGTAAPSAGLVQPTGGIGKVWREATASHVRERLGWATGPELDGVGAIETFERGFMVWAPGPKDIFLLAATTSDQPQQMLQTWRAYADTVVE